MKRKFFCDELKRVEEVLNSEMKSCTSGSWTSW